MSDYDWYEPDLLSFISTPRGARNFAIATILGITLCIGSSISSCRKESTKEETVLEKEVNNSFNADKKDYKNVMEKKETKEENKEETKEETKEEDKEDKDEPKYTLKSDEDLDKYYQERKTKERSKTTSFESCRHGIKAP